MKNKYRFQGNLIPFPKRTIEQTFAEYTRDVSMDINDLRGLVS